MKPAAELWWRRVPTAERLVATAIDDILAGRSVQIFPDMVWKDEFIDCVLARVMDEDPSIAEVNFDGAFDGSAGLIDLIAEQLGFGFNFDGRLETLLGHLRTGGGYVWRLSGLSSRRLSEACQLIRELARQKARISVMLEDGAQRSFKSVFQLKLNITRMDVRYFAWTMLLERNEALPLEYAAVLCEELSGGDPERCAALCANIDELMRDACAVCDWLTEQEVQSAVHLAQLRGVQPAIEAQRLRFIASLGRRIDAILPLTDEYGGQFTRPQELELRHLIYKRHELALSPAELALLNQLYDARNDLAHLKILPREAIEALAAR